MLSLILVPIVLAIIALAADTGCDMTPDSDLMKCLGSYASVPPVPTATASQAQAAELCAVYTRLANCWAEGTYCREWLPIQTAADKLCALASMGSMGSTSLGATSLMSNNSTDSTSTGFTLALSSSATSSLPPNATLITATAASDSSTITSTPGSPTSSPSASGIASETLNSVVAEASQVLTSIWNNDSGTDIPVISNDINPTETRPTWTKAGETSPGQTSSASVTAASGTVGEGDSGSSGAIKSMKPSAYSFGAVGLSVSLTLWCA